MAQTLDAGSADAMSSTREEFLELVCADEELLRAEATTSDRKGTVMAIGEGRLLQ